MISAGSHPPLAGRTPRDSALEPRTYGNPLNPAITFFESLYPFRRALETPKANRDPAVNNTRNRYTITVWSRAGPVDKSNIPTFNSRQMNPTNSRAFCGNSVYDVIPTVELFQPSKLR